MWIWFSFWRTSCRSGPFRTRYWTSDKKKRAGFFFWEPERPLAYQGGLPDGTKRYFLPRWLDVDLYERSKSMRVSFVCRLTTPSVPDLAWVVDEWMSIAHWWIGSDWRKLKHAEKNVSQHHFVRNKSHMDWSMTEPRISAMRGRWLAICALVRP